MNGIVAVVQRKKGKVAVKQLEKNFGAPVQFAELKNYPDEEFAKLAGAAMKVLGISSPEELQKAIAPDLLDFVVGKYPNIPKQHKDLFSFLSVIGQIHHSIPGAFAKEEKIKVVEKDEKNKVLTIRYKSPNKLDTLFIELIKCSAKYYGQKVEIEVLSKMTEGAEATVVRVKIV